MRKWTLLVALMVLVITACGDGDESAPDAAPTPTTGAEAAPETTAAETTAAEDDLIDEVSMPGAGLSIRMARANWSTGYFQAEVYRALLEELGYEVSDPSQAELGPDIFYVGLAGGDFDFWVNSWFPNHYNFLSGELADGSLVTANNDFLTANPAAATLLEQVKIGVLDVALQNVRMDAGENSQTDHSPPRPRMDRSQPRHHRRMAPSRPHRQLTGPLVTVERRRPLGAPPLFQPHSRLR